MTKVGDKFGILPICVGYCISLKLLECEQMEFGPLWYLVLQKGVRMKKLTLMLKWGVQCAPASQFQHPCYSHFSHSKWT